MQHNKKTTTAPAHSRLAIALISACALLLASTPAQAVPVTNSRLYYGMGGGTPGGAANNGRQVAQKLGIAGAIRMNYSCGKFDVGASWQTLMNGFSQIGDTITGAVQAGIAALPLYALQRAQPGLYQMFQTYSQKADLTISQALKTCEEMEAQIKAGGDPYEDWIKAAKGDLWKIKANASGDVVQAKMDINKNEQAQNLGINWVFQRRAGGANSAAIEPIHDLSIAGYNVTLNKPTTASATADYSASAAERNTRLVQAFKTPEALAKWSTEVLGDKKIYTCTQGSAGCPEPTNVTVATGLGPKYEAEFDQVAPTLQQLTGIAPGTPAGTEYEALDKIAAPGFAVSAQLVDAVRKLPRDQRAVATNRLAHELAMQRVVDKALVARQVLLTGLTLPEVAAAGSAAEDTRKTIARLNQYINDLMFESRIRKELTSNTALAILDERAGQDSTSALVAPGSPIDHQPLRDGAVRN